MPGYAIYVRKQLVDERTLHRRAWIDGKRLQQQLLKHEVMLADATLLLVGEPRDRQVRYDLHGPGAQEFKTAVRYVEAKARAAAAAEQRPQPARATRRDATPVVPTAPKVAGVRRRRDLNKAEIDKREAEIQALATPDAIDLARAAEEADRSYKQQRAAAHEADRVARDRHRSGRKPSPQSPEPALQIRFLPNGGSDVRSVPPEATPEQIARGERPTDTAEQA